MNIYYIQNYSEDDFQNKEYANSFKLTKHYEHRKRKARIKEFQKKAILNEISLK